jgi:hypothetical protein
MGKKVVYIQIGEHGIDRDFCLTAYQGFKWDERDWQIELFNPVNGLPEINELNPIIGTVEVIGKAFKKAGLTLPLPLNIPDALLPFAERKIWTSTMSEFLANPRLPVFIKPKNSAKLFSGGVLESAFTAKLLFNDIPLETEVILSEPIDIVTEYRCFVSKGRGDFSISHYLGNPFIVPSKLRIEEMIKVYNQTAPRAYSLDVGVDNKGETVIIEINDFFSLGSCNCDSIRYARLTAQRWDEMVEQAKSL